METSGRLGVRHHPSPGSSSMTMRFCSTSGNQTRRRLQMRISFVARTSRRMRYVHTQYTLPKLPCQLLHVCLTPCRHASLIVTGARLRILHRAEGAALARTTVAHEDACAHSSAGVPEHSGEDQRRAATSRAWLRSGVLLSLNSVAQAWAPHCCSAVGSSPPIACM